MHGRAPLAAFVALSVLVACADLKSGGDEVAATAPSDPQSMPGSPAAGASSGGTSDGGSSDAGRSPGSSGSSGNTSSGGAADVWAGKGQGPFGPKPTGLCCASDDECRSGRCARIGVEPDAVDACADTCTTTATCARPGPLSFVCYPSAGVCAIDTFEPQTCIPPSSFTFGTKPLGACCTVKPDGTNGLECASSVCVAGFGGPGVCTRTCSADVDCATGFACEGGPRGGRCVPTSAAYECK